MQEELENHIIVAASEAKLMGFVGTHEALLHLLNVVKAIDAYVTSPVDFKPLTPTEDL